MSERQLPKVREKKFNKASVSAKALKIVHKRGSHVRKKDFCVLVETCHVSILPIRFFAVSYFPNRPCYRVQFVTSSKVYLLAQMFLKVKHPWEYFIFKL